MVCEKTLFTLLLKVPLGSQFPHTNTAQTSQKFLFPFSFFFFLGRLVSSFASLALCVFLHRHHAAKLCAHQRFVLLCADTSLPPRTRQKSDCVKREKLQVHIPQCCTPLFPPILHMHARTHTRARTHTYSIKRHGSAYTQTPRLVIGRRGGRRRRRSVFAVIMLLFLRHKMGHGKKKKKEEPETI